MKALIDGEKRCSKCDTFKPLNGFHNQKGTPTGKAHWCKPCANKNARDNHKRRMKEDPEYRESKRNAYIKTTYGITSEEYEAMLEAQNYKCAICEVKLLSRGTGTHLDHSHKTGKLRAMLCTNCNRGLGHFKDSTFNLEKAISYLKTHECREGGYR